MELDHLESRDGRRIGGSEGGREHTVISSCS